MPSLWDHYKLGWSNGMCLSRMSFFSSKRSVMFKSWSSCHFDNMHERKVAGYTPCTFTCPEFSAVDWKILNLNRLHRFLITILNSVVTPHIAKIVQDSIICFKFQWFSAILNDCCCREYVYVCSKPFHSCRSFGAWLCSVRRLNLLWNLPAATNVWCIQWVLLFTFVSWPGLSTLWCTLNARF